MPTIGQRIRQIREQHGLSQVELGQRISRTGAAISDIERGKASLTVDNLEAIARALDVSPTRILGLYNNQPPSAYSAELAHVLDTLPDAYRAEVLDAVRATLRVAEAAAKYQTTTLRALSNEDRPDIAASRVRSEDKLLDFTPEREQEIDAQARRHHESGAAEIEEEDG